MVWLRRSLVAEAAQKEDSQAASVTVVYMLRIFENNGNQWQLMASWKDHGFFKRLYPLQGSE